MEQASVYGFDERPDLLGPWAQMPHGWPPFLLHTRAPAVDIAEVRARFSPFKRFLVDDGGRVIGHIFGVTLRWQGTVADLPPTWNAVVERAVAQQHEGISSNTVCALGAEVRRGHAGRGLGAKMLADLAAVARARGLEHFLAPARPGHKPARASTADYISRRRPDGLPVDPWLRVHARAGASAVAIAEAAVVVEAPVARWRRWSGLPLLESGEYEVRGALHPVRIDIASDLGTYAEDAVWMHRKLGR